MISSDAIKSLADQHKNWPLNFHSSSRVNRTFLNEKETFYMQLNKTFKGVWVGDRKIPSIDLHAKVGGDNKYWVKSMDRQGLGSMNENEELFANSKSSNYWWDHLTTSFRLIIQTCSFLDVKNNKWAKFIHEQHHGWKYPH